MSSAELLERIASLESTLAEVIASDELLSRNIDAWYLAWISTMVFFQQTGFALLEAGTVSARATQHILLKNIMDVAISALAWWAIGLALACDGSNAFIGTATGDSATTSFLLIGAETVDARGARVSPAHTARAEPMQRTSSGAGPQSITPAVSQTSPSLSLLRYPFLTPSLPLGHACRTHSLTHTLPYPALTPCPSLSPLRESGSNLRVFAPGGVRG